MNLPWWNNPINCYNIWNVSGIYICVQAVRFFHLEYDTVDQNFCKNIPMSRRLKGINKIVLTIVFFVGCIAGRFCSVHCALKTCNSYKKPSTVHYIYTLDAFHSNLMSPMKKYAPEKQKCIEIWNLMILYFELKKHLSLRHIFVLISTALPFDRLATFFIRIFLKASL